MPYRSSCSAARRSSQSISRSKSILEAKSFRPRLVTRLISCPSRRYSLEIRLPSPVHRGWDFFSNDDGSLNMDCPSYGVTSPKPHGAAPSPGSLAHPWTNRRARSVRADESSNALPLRHTPSMSLCATSRFALLAAPTEHIYRHHACANHSYDCGPQPFGTPALSSFSTRFALADHLAYRYEACRRASRASQRHFASREDRYGP